MYDTEEAEFTRHAPSSLFSVVYWLPFSQPRCLSHSRRWIRRIRRMNGTLYQPSKREGVPILPEQARFPPPFQPAL